jgi:hypothetical protein
MHQNLCCIMPLLRDDVANGFEAPFIIARCLLEVFGEHPQHRGLELDERLGSVETDGGAGSGPLVLSPYGGRLSGVPQPCCFTPFGFCFAPAASTPNASRAGLVSQEGH